MCADRERWWWARRKSLGEGFLVAWGSVSVFRRFCFGKREEMDTRLGFVTGWSSLMSTCVLPGKPVRVGGNGLVLSSPCRWMNVRAPRRCCVVRMTVGGGSGNGVDFWRKVENVLDRSTSLFPLWVLLGALVGIYLPQLVIWFRGGWVLWTLSVIMLGMGLTLPVSELLTAMKSPALVIFGAFAQFSIMPLLGLAISKLMQLPEPYMLGLVLVSTCPGGAASNLVCLLCGANVSLSVLMTTTTTLLSVFLTPTLLKFLVGKVVSIDATALMLSTMRMVLLPLLVGVLMQRCVHTRQRENASTGVALLLTLFFRRKTPRLVSAVSSALPPISVLGVTMICSSIVGANSAALTTSGPTLLISVILLHSLGFLLGYVVSKLAGHAERNARTISIEVGMQNSGLGAALAQLHFANPLTAVPAAISATTHSIIGSLLAAAWRYRDQLSMTTNRDEL